MSTTYNLSNIPISKLNSVGKQNNYNNYISRLVTRNDFNLISKYVGYHTLEELVLFIQVYKPSGIKNKHELKYWITLMFSNWIRGVNLRLQIADDFLLIKHIIAEFILNITKEGKENLKTTINYINSININDLLELVPETNEQSDDDDDELLNDEDTN